MQRQHTGRPGTVVVPDGWSDAPAVAMAKTMSSAIIIGPAGGMPAWNEGTGQMETPADSAVYTGSASLMPVSDSARILTVVEDPSSTRVYEIGLPRDADGVDLVQALHMILVTGSHDGRLIGKTLAVTAVEHGSQRFSRILLALLNE